MKKKMTMVEAEKFLIKFMEDNGLRGIVTILHNNEGTGVTNLAHNMSPTEIVAYLELFKAQVIAKHLSNATYEAR